tara:strand:+ start:8826 stop:9692 length:867 start_codon:yes stop_codon:yes gene_type:complete
MVFNNFDLIRTVYCRPIGGLGNQLFILCAAISYANDNDRKLILIHYKGGTGIDNMSQRPTYLNNLFYKLKSHMGIESGNITTIYEQKDGTLITKSYEKSVYLSGYFQSPKYFIKYKQELIDYFEFNKYQTERRDSISLHFRIGDYKSNQDYHPILTINYYKNAIKSICEKTKNNWLIEWCCENGDIDHANKTIKELINSFPEMHFKRINPNLCDWELMMYLSCSTHNIIANSTFSWWGAYLNPNIEKIVTYPSIWFGESVNKRVDNMFPANWIQCQVTTFNTVGVIYD